VLGHVKINKLELLIIAAKHGAVYLTFLLANVLTENIDIGVEI